MKRSMIWLVLAALITANRATSAQPAADKTTAERAQALYKEGKRHFEIAEYAEAISSWKESYLLSSAPLLLFNLGQAYRLSGNCAQANRFYLNYKRVEPKPPNKAELDKAMARCTGVEPASGEPTVTDAKPAVTDAKPAVTDAKPAVTDTRPIVKKQVPPPPSRRASAAGGGFRIAGLAFVAVGTFALGGSVVLAVSANKTANLISGQQMGTAWSTVASQDQAGHTAATRAQLLGVVGAVTLIGGGVLWWIGHKRAESHVEVSLSPGHTEVTWSCAF